MKKLGFFAALVLAVSVFQSCQKEPLDPHAGKEAPQLPAAATFILPIDDKFKEELTDNDPNDRTINNWGHSVANVIFWNTVLTVHTAVPVLAFYESFNHEAVYQGGGIWLWAYTVSDNSGTYHAKLYGELLVNSEVKWDMYISKDGAFSDVLWYSGITAWDQSYASWTLNYNPFNPTPFITIEYLKDNGAGQASIRYTNVIPGDAGNGSYIEYRESADASAEFDRAYDVFKSDIDNLLEINWNSIDSHGRVRDFEKFGDLDWHCWGTDLQDGQC
ncbi:MAG: hypothetical protein IPH04_20860 [Saprospirales bacterium]|nr:hypothetical protein [Saprospirales bacterium]